MHLSESLLHCIVMRRMIIYSIPCVTEKEEPSFSSEAVRPELAYAHEKEKPIETKAAGADLVGMLSVIIMPFSVDQLLGLPKDTSHIGVLLHGTCVGLSLSCILLMTFLSLKIRRLTSRSDMYVESVFRYQSDKDKDKLEYKGNRDLMKALTPNGDVKEESELHARRWYYHGIEKGLGPYYVNGQRLYEYGICTFQWQLITFTITVLHLMCTQHGVSILKVASIPLVLLPGFFCTLLLLARGHADLI